MKGYAPEQLIELRGLPDFPEMFGYLWDWFISLSHTRQPGFGAAPITEQEIHAFCCNRGMHMSLFELDAIRALDRIALTDYSKEPEDD